MEISQNFVAFSEYTNFTHCLQELHKAWFCHKFLHSCKEMNQTKDYDQIWILLWLAHWWLYEPYKFQIKQKTILTMEGVLFPHGSNVFKKRFIKTLGTEGWRTFQTRTFHPQASTPDLSTPNVSTMSFPTTDFSTQDSTFHPWNFQPQTSQTRTFKPQIWG